MPAKSQAQRELLNARFGHQWVKAHHFDNRGKLPAHVKGKHMAKQSSGAKKVAVFMAKKKPAGPPKFPSPYAQQTSRPGQLSGGTKVTEDDPRWAPSSKNKAWRKKWRSDSPNYKGVGRPT
jgi:hypothetical protein